MPSCKSRADCYKFGEWELQGWLCHVKECSYNLQQEVLEEHLGGGSRAEQNVEGCNFGCGRLADVPTTGLVCLWPGSNQGLLVSPGHGHA